MRVVMKSVLVLLVVTALGLVSGCGGGGVTGPVAGGGTSTSPSSSPSASPSAGVASDGAVLYEANCAGCHGALAVSSKTGITLARLQSAISNGTGGMGFLSSLTAAEQQAIVGALNPAAPTPVPTPTPVPNPAPSADGVLLYSSNCAGCHGPLATSPKKGMTLARLQNAIASNTGNMGFLSSLTSIQQQALVTALAVTPVPTPTPAPTPVTDGATLYATNCANCHGALASSGKAGATAARILAAISNNTGGMGSLATLSTTQVNAIASALVVVTPGPAQTPVCGSCHAIPPASGRHSRHASKGIACATCHGSGYSTTTVNAATHNNGIKNLTSTIGWTAAGSCANSCHGSRVW